MLSLEVGPKDILETGTCHWSDSGVKDYEAPPEEEEDGGGDGGLLPDPTLNSNMAKGLLCLMSFQFPYVHVASSLASAASPTPGVSVQSCAKIKPQFGPG